MLVPLPVNIFLLICCYQIRLGGVIIPNCLSFPLAVAQIPLGFLDHHRSLAACQPLFMRYCFFFDPFVLPLVLPESRPKAQAGR